MSESEYQDALTELVNSTVNTKERFDRVLALGRSLNKSDDDIKKDIKAAFRGLSKATYYRHLSHELKRPYRKSQSETFRPRLEHKEPIEVVMTSEGHSKTIREKDELEGRDTETSGSDPIGADEPNAVEEWRKQAEQEKSKDELIAYLQNRVAELEASRNESLVVHMTAESLRNNFAHIFMANKNGTGVYYYIKNLECYKALADNEKQVEVATQ